MIIDFHIHMGLPQPPGSQEKKAPPPPGPTPEITEKTPEGIKKRLSEMGISHVVVQNFAPRAELCKPMNDYARKLATEYDGFFYQYGAYHPDNPPEDLIELKESGLFYGVKLHPYLQRFDLLDPRMYAAYELLSSLQLPILIHAGRDPFNDLTYGYSQKVAQIHKDFPDLTIVAAHLGGLQMYDEAEEYVIGKDMYIDVSVSVVFCDPDRYKRILLKHDPDRILFGSDCPMGNPQKELDFLKSLNLSSDLTDKILYRNAQRLLGM